MEEREGNTNGHTPGPWTASDERRGIFEIIHDGDLLAQVWGVRPAGDGDLPAEANARLIAAAPELLEACQEALVWADNAGLKGRLAAAIAKAEGR